MKVRGPVRESLDWLDCRCSAALHACASGNSHLLVAAFHSVIPAHGAAEALLAPNQAVTLDEFSRFLHALLEAGYLPCSLEDLRDQRAPGPKRFLLTFDDGYFNNVSVLPVLERLEVPAIFFISTDHVQRSMAFWWDVASRLYRMHGASEHQVRASLEHLKQRSQCEVIRELVRTLGPMALTPVSDLDRPFTTSELKDFARSRWVRLGNHTADHAILTRCSPMEAWTSMLEGRRMLERIGGVPVDAIAYPNGCFSSSTVNAARAIGHRFGFTCLPRANVLPMIDEARMRIGRHIIPTRVKYAEQIARWSSTRILPGERARTGARRFREFASRFDG